MKHGISKHKHLRLLAMAVTLSAFAFSPNVSAKDLTQNLQLDSDITENLVVKSGSNITIDLNNHNITTTNVDAIYIENNASATIIGNGTVEATGKGYAAIFNNGNATIKGGTFLKDEAKGSWYAVLNHGIMTFENGTVKMNNFVTSSLVDNGYSNFNSVNERTGYVVGKGIEKPSLTINGGTFDGGLNTIKNDDNATLTINGGKFQNNVQVAVLNWNYATINGGTFEVPTGNDKTTLFNGYSTSGTLNNGVLKVTGGTFNSEYFIEGSAKTTDPIVVTGGNINATKGIINPRENDNIDGTNFVMSNTVSLTDPDKSLIPEGYTVYFANTFYIVDKEATVTVPSEIFVAKDKIVSLNIEANDTAYKYMSVTSSNKEIADMKDNGVLGIAPGTTTIKVDLKNGTVKEITVHVYEVIADEETKENESEVTDTVNDIINGKETEGIDKETANKVIESVKNGEKITTELEANEVKEETIAEEVKQKVSEVIKDEEIIAGYFDINFLLKGNDVELGKVTKLNNSVKVSLELPTTIKEVEEGYTRTYYVIRLHDGQVEKLDASIVDGKLTFETDRFSNYAISYVDTKIDDKDENLDDVPKTGDITKLIILGTSIVGLVAYVVIKKKKLFN